MILQYLESGQLADSGGRLCPPALAAGSTGTLIIPAAVSYFCVRQFTPQQRRHLQASLPWMLEEYLLEPVENFHISHARAGTYGTEVLAVKRDWLQECLRQCQAAGLVPERVYCSYSLVPWQPGQISLWQDGVQASLLLRDTHGQGISCLPENLDAVLGLLIQEHGLPDAVVLYGTESWAGAIVPLVPGVVRSALQVAAQPGLDELVSRITPASCNLLQGGFAAAPAWGQWWRSWRWVAGLLLALLLADVLVTGARVLTQQRDLATLDQDMGAVFSQAMPGAVMIDAPLQLERAVLGLGGQGQDGLLVLLTRMAPALKQVPQAQIQSLDYDQRSGALQLLIRSADLGSAQTLNTQLRAQGLQVDLVGSNSDSAGTQSRFRVGM